MSAVLLEQIPVSQIDPSPFQHRRHFDDGALQELARSIKEDGLIQPITVRRTGKRFELIAGERRWRASSQYAGLQEITARILDCDDLQARRLCAVENLQRADLTAIEEVQALAELIDSELLIEFGDEYAQIQKLQEPKWRVKALLTLIESDRRHGTDKVASKFTGKCRSVFSSLPKPKDLISFATNDLPILFTSAEVQEFAVQFKLNKSQTKAVQKLADDGGEKVKKAMADTTGQAFVSLLKNDLLIIDDVEEVRDFAARDIKRAAAVQKAQHRDRIKAIELPEFNASPAITTCERGWYRIDNQYLYCGSNLDREFLDQLPRAAFAFADPPYNAGVDEWDSGFNWEQDYLEEFADVVAVTPGGWNAAEFYRQTRMTYQWEMACWIRNGMTHGRCGYANWIKASIFGKKPKIQQDFFDITIKTSETVDTSHRGRKPYPFMSYMIDIFSKPGDTVIDPFGGSGTTLLMCHQMNRISYNAELDATYCAQIIERAKALGANCERV